jgi:hypothetical protein
MKEMGNWSELHSENTYFNGEVMAHDCINYLLINIAFVEIFCTPQIPV